MHILKIKNEKRDVGNVGEGEVCKYLKKHRFKIKERNYVAGGHEIDLIAENKEFICFVEVKTRTIGKENPAEPRPASSVTPEKQRSIIQAARQYLGGYFTDKMIRFDVAEVYVEENKRLVSINYIEGAFNYNTAHVRKWNT
ncbi:MAG: YraN family protein [Clostridia bacterium]|nr:YraN family protein [Clostridia bacterium]